jgi:ATP-binding cassette subfamily A (ABC1) protein 3
MTGTLSSQAELLERSSALRFRYSLPKVSGNLSALFGAFEKNKERLQISEYAIGQTTLEQIFNHFASSQDNPEVQ